MCVCGRGGGGDEQPQISNKRTLVKVNIDQGGIHRALRSKNRGSASLSSPTNAGAAGREA